MTSAPFVYVSVFGGAGAVWIVDEALSSGQNYTLLGVLIVVLSGVAKILHWGATRFVTSIDNQSDKVTAALESHSKTVVGNTTELGKLVAVLSSHDATVKQMKNQIEKLPRNVVDEIRLRRADERPLP